MSANDPTDGLWFSITIENEEFIAFVSADALLIHFDAPSKMNNALLRAYQQHQHIIDAAAHRKFFSGAVRPIKLSVGDF
jgi:hypothetical protein